MLSPGALSWRQNFETSTDGKTRTAPGWARPYANQSIIQTNGVPCTYQNWDFHDQSPVIDITKLEPPTLLFKSVANDRTRRLYMGTKSRLLLMDETAGTWGDLVALNTFGQDGSNVLTQIRWKCDQLQDKIFFTNGFDPLQYTVVGSNSATEVTGLRGAGILGVDVTAAEVILQYQGVIIIMNTTEGGVQCGSRVRWSDLNDGTFWGTGTNNPNTGGTSISDYQDLNYGENILGAVELYGFLYILTDKGIWKCSFVVDNTTSPPSANLLAVEVYVEEEDESRCVFYPNAMCSDGDSIYYAGHDAIYRYNQYMTDPERTEWIFRSTSIVYDDPVLGATIDEAMVESPVMVYWPDNKEIHFSWPVPDAIYTGPPSCTPIAPVFTSGLNRFTLVINTSWNTCDYRDYGMNAYVNWKPELAIGYTTLDTKFFGSATADLCLKQLGFGAAREVYSAKNQVYSAAGYVPLIRGVFPLGAKDSEKQVKWAVVDGIYPATPINIFSFRFGSARTTTAVNSNPNGIVWYPPQTRPCVNLSKMSSVGYVKANQRPNVDMRFVRQTRGVWIFFELSILQPNGSPPVDGGVILTSLKADTLLV